MLGLGAGLGAVGMAPGVVTEAMSGNEDTVIVGAGGTPGVR